MVNERKLPLNNYHKDEQIDYGRTRMTKNLQTILRGLYTRKCVSVCRTVRVGTRYYSGFKLS